MHEIVYFCSLRTLGVRDDTARCTQAQLACLPAAAVILCARRAARAELTQHRARLCVYCAQHGLSLVLHNRATNSCVSSYSCWRCLNHLKTTHNATPLSLLACPPLTCPRRRLPPKQPTARQLKAVVTPTPLRQAQREWEDLGWASALNTIVLPLV